MPPRAVEPLVLAAWLNTRKFPWAATSDSEVRFPPRPCENSVALPPRARSRRKAAGVGKGDTQQPRITQQSCWLPLRHGVFTQPAPEAATRRIGSSDTQGAEGHQMPQPLGRWDAVLPLVPRRPPQQVSGSRLEGQRGASPGGAGPVPQPEEAGSAERDAEHMVEHGLVAVPADRRASAEESSKHRGSRLSAPARASKIANKQPTRPQSARFGPRRRPDKVHADKAYDHRRCRGGCRNRGVKPCIARRGVEGSRSLGRHRWAVARTLAWMNRFRRLAIRYGRRLDIRHVSTALACSLICLKAFRNWR